MTTCRLCRANVPFRSPCRSGNSCEIKVSTDFQTVGTVFVVVQACCLNRNPEANLITMHPCQFPATVRSRLWVTLALSALFAFAHLAAAAKPGDRVSSVTTDRRGAQYSDTETELSSNDLFDWEPTSGLALNVGDAKDAGGGGGQMTTATCMQPSPLDDAVRLSVRGSGEASRTSWKSSESSASRVGDKSVTGKAAMTDTQRKKLEKGAPVGNNLRTANQGQPPEPALPIWLTCVVGFIVAIAVVLPAVIYWRSRAVWMLIME